MNKHKSSVLGDSFLLTLGRTKIRKETRYLTMTNNTTDIENPKKGKNLLVTFVKENIPVIAKSFKKL